MEDAQRAQSTETADINKNNKRTLSQTGKDKKILPHTKALIEQRRKCNSNGPVPQEICAINKEISRNIPKDIRQYNKEHIEQTIEQNISLKVLGRK